MKRFTSLLVIIAFGVVLTLVGCTAKPKVHNEYLIPENYTGWVYVIFHQDGYSEITENNGKYQFIIGKDGILKTSTKDVKYGVSTDDYFYVDKNNNKTPINTDELIHSRKITKAESQEGEKKINYPAVESFFVGTEQQFENSPGVTYPKDIKPIEDK